MAKYETRFKKALVQEYLSGELGYRALAAKYEIGHASIRGWVERYRAHGDAGLEKKFSHYDIQFKVAVLERMWAQKLSYRQVAALYDLRGGTGVVASWERQYHEGGVTALAPKPRGRPLKMNTPNNPKPVGGQPQEARALEELRKENEYLRAEVAYLKKLDALVREKKQAALQKRKP